MKFLNDLLGQLWTLIGLIIAWVVLEGSAKTFTGWLVLAGTALWVATYWLRNKSE